MLLHHVFGEQEGEDGAWGHAVGGMGSITEAMAKSAAAHGVDIEVNAPAAEVIVERGRAQGVALADGRQIRARLVAANVNPKLLFGRLLDPSRLPEEFARDIAKYRCASGTLRMNVALSELPDFTARPGKGDHLHGIDLDHPLDRLSRRGLQRCQGIRDREEAGRRAVHSSTIDPTLAPQGPCRKPVLPAFQPGAARWPRLGRRLRGGGPIW